MGLVARQQQTNARITGINWYHATVTHTSEVATAAMFNARKTSIQVHLVALPLVVWGLERLVQSARSQMALTGSTASVADCLLALQKQPADVVVLDLDGDDNIDALADLHCQTKAKILVITASRDETLNDTAVLAGARGVVNKRELPSTLLKAIEKVHEGEVWIDRNATSRLFLTLARTKAAKKQDPELEKMANLTPRERQTMDAVTTDVRVSSKQMAERLNISEHTLRNHLTSIYRKLELSNRMDLYLYVQRHGLSEKQAE